MGQPLSLARTALMDNPSVEIKEAVNETLDIVSALAEAELDLLQAKVRSQNADRDLPPIDREIMKKAYFYADNKWRAPQTATLVKYEGIRFIGGAVASGIADIIDLALLEMQHAPSEAKQTREACLVAVGALGTLLRLDMSIFTYRFRGKHVSEVMVHFNTVLVIISSIKVEGMTKGSLAAITQRAYGRCDTLQQRDIFEELDAARKAQQKES